MRAGGEQVGHVTTHEYGSQMLSLGGVHHLTGGSKAEGNATCDALMKLCNKEPVELVDRRRLDHRGRRPTSRRSSTARREERMRVGCGSAVTGIFAKQWLGLADEVVVVDEHITGVFTEHQAGKLLDVRPSGLKIRGRKSTPGRYFKVAEPGLGWGGTNLKDPLEIIKGFDAKVGVAGPAAVHGLDHRRASRLVRARRDADAARGRAAGGHHQARRAHRRELRAGAVDRAVHGRRRRQPAGRRHREPGATDAGRSRTASPGSPAAARRPTSGPAAASP